MAISFFYPFPIRSTLIRASVRVLWSWLLLFFPPCFWNRIPFLWHVVDVVFPFLRRLHVGRQWRFSPNVPRILLIQSSSVARSTILHGCACRLKMLWVRDRLVLGSRQSDPGVSQLRPSRLPVHLFCAFHLESTGDSKRRWCRIKYGFISHRLFFFRSFD